jgi:hypothetical protein
MENQGHQREDNFESIALQESDLLETPSQKRGFIEVLLDPKTLHGLMLSGGGLLVLGLVVWLWSVGVFENRLVVASFLGAGNVALLATGILGVLKTRYQTASKAITLLACLLMPLNLWFYDAQGLITLDQGGHLWVPALACCAIYVAVARILKEPRFAYTIVGGITLTGMLFLADQQIGHFWEIMAPATFLVVLGGICIHFERVFPLGDGPFSRNAFGREFFRAGHIVMGAGLVVLLVGRLSGWLYEPFLADLNWFAMPEVATQAKLKLFALALTVGGTYAYVYSHFAVSERKQYLTAALLTSIWSVVVLLDLLAVPFTMEYVTLFLALTALVANITTWITSPAEATTETNAGLPAWIAPFVNLATSLGVALNVATVCFAAVLYGRDRIDFFYQLMPYEFGWVYLAAVLVGSVACLLGLRSAHRNGASIENSWHLQGLALLGMFTIAASLSCLGVPLTIASLSLELLLPLIVALLSLFARTKAIQRSGARMAEIATSLMLIVGLGAVLGLVSLDAVNYANLWLTVFFAVSAVSFGLASVHATRVTSAVLAAGCVCMSTWFLLIYFGVTQYGFFLASSLVGTVFLAAAEISTRLRDKTSTFAQVSLWTGRVCISCGGVAVILMSAARLLTSETHGAMLGVLAAQIAAAVVAAILSKKSTWRHYFLVLAAAEVAIVLLVVNALSVLSFLQRGELLLTSVGLFVLSAGYLGWYKESDQRKELTSVNLALGSLLSAVPITLGLLVQRFSDHNASWGWVLMHEAGVLVIALVLIGAGVLCRIRWSTLVGAATMCIYVISLIGLFQLLERLQTTAVYMMAGGSLFFGTAVLLSIYRDRLLALPQRAQEGRGVFRIFKWR